MLADQSVCVGWISDDDSFNITSAVVVDGFTSINKNFSVVFKKVSAFHARSTRFGSNEEVVIYFFECSAEAAGDNNFIEKRESAIMEFSLDTLENLFLEGEVEQVKDDSLVFAKEFTTKIFNKIFSKLT